MRIFLNCLWSWGRTSVGGSLSNLFIRHERDRQPFFFGLAFERDSSPDSSFIHWTQEDTRDSEWEPSDKNGRMKRERERNWNRLLHSLSMLVNPVVFFLLLMLSIFSTKKTMIQLRIKVCKLLSRVSEEHDSASQIKRHRGRQTNDRQTNKGMRSRSTSW